ncbi:MAG TPA: hypothetical protein VH081_07175 [Solirubrobacteraceae bacterium]|jgi:hypothetical protein|nr:hypothetical protein [Solirubrobacteraceae bacterium]
MSAVPTLAPDAAFVLGIAATAIPFARTPDDEAERWLRLLRLHGEVGATLQALGVSEGSLTEHDATAQARGAGLSSNGSADGEPRDVIALVSERAVRLADERGADGVGTTELLLSVLDVYGEAFERTLRAHGTDSSEVLERLAA